jgi:antitoxin FitA
MPSTRTHAHRNMVTLQIRNVPSGVHRQLKAHAAPEGVSLSDYLLRQLSYAVGRPTLDEIQERLSRRQPRAAPAYTGSRRAR